MDRSKNISILILTLLGAFVSLAVWGLFFTAPGSVWVLREYLAREMGSDKPEIVSSEGNLFTGLTLKGIRSGGVRILDSTGSAAVGEARVRILWNKTGPYFSVQAGPIDLSLDGAFKNAAIQRLNLNEKSLDLYQVIVKGLKKFPAGSAAEIESISFDLPMKTESPLKAGNIAFGSGLGAVHIEKVSGSATGLVFQNIEVKEIPFLRKEDAIQIQKIKISEPFRLEDIHFVENGRLNLAGSDAILFYGTQDKKQFNFNVFSKSAELGSILSATELFKGASASVSDVDIDVNGSWDNVKIQGSWVVDRLFFRRFYLKECPVSSAHLRLKRSGKSYELEGEVDMSGGEIIHKNIHLFLEPGKIVFKGDPEAPFFDLTATTLIADTLINVRLRGLPDRPDLSLSSDPSYSEEKILIMLVTGKEWPGSERALSEGRVSADAAKEFIDYFLMGGTGEKLARRLGIKEVSLLADENVKGLEVKKAVSKKMDVAYGVEKKGTETEKGAVAQKVGVDYKASSDVSVSVEGKVESQNRTAGNVDGREPAAEKSLTMKVKRSF